MIKLGKLIINKIREREIEMHDEFYNFHDFLYCSGCL